MKLPAIVADPHFMLHLTGVGHVESPGRFKSIMQALQEAGLMTKENSLLPRVATHAEIALGHSAEYIALVEEETAHCHGICTLSTGDVQICKDSGNIAKLAAGAVLQGIDAVFTSQFPTAFCIVRPPGHHACRTHGMGFCLFNNVAIGALYALQTYGFKKVLIVDWDVHHGNGTQEIVQSNPSVFYFSTHQSPLYPGTGAASEKGVGNVLNVPIAAGVNSRQQVLKAFREDLTHAMEIYKPEFVLVSAGFDAHSQDLLGGMNLTEEDFAELTHIVKAIASKFANGRLVSVLEGGYNLDALGRSAVAHVQALAS